VNAIMADNQMKVLRIPVHRQRIANNMPINLTRKRVCAYCRVSNDEYGQISSFDLQVKYYTDFITSNSRWEFAGVYADYGKSGTSTKKRTEFMHMIEDCRRGKIDLILTKSVTRFARNTLDCMNYVRELRGLMPPVGIYFEKEKINTLDQKNEILLTILSSLAQEEARNISENVKWGIQKRFQAGKPRCPTNFLLGYDKDEHGNLIINAEEAVTVHRVFREYMEGKGAKLIAQELKADGIISGRGKVTWGKSSILHMLKNERYCGDVLMQKIFTVDFLTHKTKENKGQLPQYYIENHHPAIIPKDEWNEVQTEINRRHQLVATKDCSIRQGYSSVSVMSNRLFCGNCGQPLNRYSVGLKKDGKMERFPAWRCRATSKKSRIKAGCELCSPKTQQERKLKDAFMVMLVALKETKCELEVKDNNASLVRIIDSLHDNPEFKDEYFRELVVKGTVYDDGKVDYVFKNGLACTAFIENDSRLHTSKS
jgi:site-specific DNA recombinase